MKYQTLPKALYAYPGVKKLLHDNESCILFKTLNRSLESQEKIATSHCFMYIITGKVEVQTQAGKTITTHSGEMLFMPRDTYLISDFVTQNESASLYLIFIGHEVIDAFLNSQLKQAHDVSDSMPTICKLKAGDTFANFFQALHQIYANIENNKAILNLKLLEFLHLVTLDNHTDIMTTLQVSEGRKRKRSIISLMHENFDKNLTIADFANLSGRSLSTFNRDFKRIYAQSPKQWLIEHKMSEANKLLIKGMSVTNSAQEVGYSNVSHFIKAYKSRYGKTPKDSKNNSF